MAEEVKEDAGEQYRSKGKVVAVQGPVVDVKFEQVEDMPDLHETVTTTTFDRQKVVMLVGEHLE